MPSRLRSNLVDISLEQLAPRLFRWLVDEHLDVILNFYPPYLGAGVDVVAIDDDFRRIEVRMPLRWYNRNYVGTQFGGSLYSMVDPFFMLIVMRHLGDRYVVWDKAAEIRFRKPGRGTVYATVDVDEEELESIRRRVDEKGVVEPEFDVDIVDEDGETVAEVLKTLHVRRDD